MHLYHFSFVFLATDRLTIQTNRGEVRVLSICEKQQKIEDDVFDGNV